MMSRLTWSALLLAALAAVACWSAEDVPDCEESRPIYGPMVCCERHRATGTPAFEVEAERRARARTHKLRSYD